ncbi:MAG: gliding motility-associated C-terminal domain-containing protein [Bacteroidales bacterium]|nr:gliding motility-associated C-terminal domain-containing protein [Bacteroidales bacterium]
MDKAQDKELTIFNRWGVEVFRSVNYENNWDGKGKNGNDLPEDTYYYVLKINDIFKNGEQRKYSGYVVIKR